MGAYATRVLVVSLLAALALLPACHSSSSSGVGDTDTGTDSDSDVDSDSDTDADSDTGSDSETEPLADGVRLEWAVNAGGITQDNGLAIGAFENGTSISAGYFSSEATFGKGEANETTCSTTSSSDSDAFLARFDIDGSLLWVERAGGDVGEYDEEQVNAVDVLPDGSTIATGMFSSISTFGAEDSIVLEPEGDWDIFVARYDSDGGVAWVKQAGGTGQDEGTAVAAFPDGGAIVAGNYQGVATFGPGEPEETVLGGPLVKGFVARYAPDGSLVWAERVGAGDNNIVFDVALNEDEYIYLVGRFMGTVVFGLGDESETSLTSTTGSEDIFLAKYKATGELEWVRSAGGESSDWARSVSIRFDDTLFVSGRIGEGAVFGMGEDNETVLEGDSLGDAFVARYGADGGLLWAEQAGGDEMDSANGNAATPGGSVVLTGKFGNGAVFGAGQPSEITLESGGEHDIFVAMYFEDGTLAWVTTVYSIESYDSGMDIAVVSDSSVFVTGHFYTTAIFGEGETNETSLGTFGSSDAFVAKYVPE